MKTLDEVIKALKVCTSDHGGCDGCPYDPDCTPDYKWDDAIQYLKEYRDYRNADKTVIGNGSVSEAKNNPPLTWDELREMQGKPVWVEVDGKWWGRFWAFVEAENDSYINFYQKGQEYPEDLWKCNMGKSWNAFRKERG